MRAYHEFNEREFADVPVRVVFEMSLDEMKELRFEIGNADVGFGTAAV